MASCLPQYLLYLIWSPFWSPTKRPGMLSWVGGITTRAITPNSVNNVGPHKAAMNSLRFLASCICSRISPCSCSVPLIFLLLPLIPTTCPVPHCPAFHHHHHRTAFHHISECPHPCRLFIRSSETCSRLLVTMTHYTQLWVMHCVQVGAQRHQGCVHVTHASTFIYAFLPCSLSRCFSLHSLRSSRF